MVKISVITVCYNAVDGIEKTILSVLNQNCSNIEYIIIDGGSNDGTEEIIRKYADKIDYWISEPDNGIYDAMNKGIRVATGDFLIFINSDDVLFCIPNEELELVKKDDLYLGLCGCIEVEHGKIQKPFFNWKMKLRNGLPHQALFYKKEFMHLYETKWKIVADYNLNLSLYKSQKCIYLSEKIISQHRAGISGCKISALESFHVIYSQYGLLWVFLSWVNRKFCAIQKCFKFR